MKKNMQRVKSTISIYSLGNSVIQVYRNISISKTFLKLIFIAFLNKTCERALNRNSNKSMKLILNKYIIDSVTMYECRYNTFRDAITKAIRLRIQ